MLRDVGQRLTAAVEVADQVKNDRDDLKSHLAEPGDQRFGSAASEFLDEWACGCGCMKDDAGKLAGLLTQAAGGYIETETAIAGMFETDG
ncbi:MAG: WXG100 family type VII secretion target [Acidimicrobiales bacterium]